MLNYIKNNYKQALTYALSTAFGVFFGILASNWNDARLERKSVEKLLTFAEINVYSQYEIINDLAKRKGIELPLEDLDKVIKQPEKAVEILNFVRMFEAPVIELPYPTVLHLVLENDDVLSNTSFLAKQHLYEIQYSLKQERALISDEKTRYIIKFQAFKDYMENLRRLNTVISNEIRYLKREITMEEYMGIYKSLEREIYGLSKEEYEFMINDYPRKIEAIKPPK